MSLLGEIVECLTFWRRDQREADKAGREVSVEERERQRFGAEGRQLAIARTERLRDNLRHRVGLEGDTSARTVLETRLQATELTLTRLYEDVALDDPRVRYYYAESMRALVPRDIAPAVQLPEPVRETAALVAAASEAAGATPADAEGHFLRANALYFLSERLEGKAITRALQDAIEAYDQALRVYTREALPQQWAMTLNNKGNVLQALGQRLEGDAGAQALRSAIEAYDQALEVRTREALSQQWATTLNNKGNVLQVLGQRLERDAGAQALRDAIVAYDLALGVYTREHFPYYHAVVVENRDRARRLLDDKMR